MTKQERGEIATVKKEVGELRSEVRDILRDIKWLKWGIGIGFAILAIVVTMVGLN